jgi:hypothetical protein
LPLVKVRRTAAQTVRVPTFGSRVRLKEFDAKAKLMPQSHPIRLSNIGPKVATPR